MKNNRKRNALKPVRYRESVDDSTDSNKQTVARLRDLRLTLNKRKKDKERHEKSKSDSGEETELIYSGDSDNKGSNRGDNLVDEESDSEIQTVTDSDNAGQADQNNNAQRVKSVVMQTTTTKKRQTKQTLVNEGQEEGEISSSDTGNIDSFVDQADDREFAAFLKRHQDRI